MPRNSWRHFVAMSTPVSLSGVIGLNKFSSLSNTAVVVIFPNPSVNSDVVYVQTWERLILKNPIEPP